MKTYEDLHRPAPFKMPPHGTVGTDLSAVQSIDVAPAVRTRVYHHFSL